MAPPVYNIGLGNAHWEELIRTAGSSEMVQYKKNRDGNGLSESLVILFINGKLNRLFNNLLDFLINLCGFMVT